MRRVRQLAVSLLAMLILLLGTRGLCWGDAGLGTSQRPIRMLIPAGLLRGGDSAELAGELALRTGLTFHPPEIIMGEEGPALDYLLSSFAGDACAFLTPQQYAEVHARTGGKATVRLVGVMAYGTPYAFASVYVRRDSGFRTLEDLQGKKWIFTNSASTLGYLLPKEVLEEADVVPSSSFEAGAHVLAIHSLKDGNGDFCTAFGTPPLPPSGVTEVWSWGDDPEKWVWNRETGSLYEEAKRGTCMDVRESLIDPQKGYSLADALSDFAVLAVMGPIPGDCMVFSPGFPPDIADVIVQAVKEHIATDEGRSLWQNEFLGWQSAVDAKLEWFQYFLGEPSCYYLAPLEVPNLSVAVKTDKDKYVTGDTVKIRLAVRNKGKLAATGVQARVVLPAGLAVAGAYVGYSDEKQSWTVGDLAVGEVRDLVLHAEVVGPRSTAEIRIELAPGTSGGADRTDDSATQRIEILGRRPTIAFIRPKVDGSCLAPWGEKILVKFRPGDAQLLKGSFALSVERKSDTGHWEDFSLKVGEFSYNKIQEFFTIDMKKGQASWDIPEDKAFPAGKYRFTAQISGQDDLEGEAVREFEVSSSASDFRFVDGNFRTVDSVLVASPSDAAEYRTYVEFHLSSSKKAFYRCGRCHIGGDEKWFLENFTKIETFVSVIQGETTNRLPVTLERSSSGVFRTTTPIVIPDEWKISGEAKLRVPTGETSFGGSKVAAATKWDLDKISVPPVTACITLGMVELQAVDGTLYLGETEGRPSKISAKYKIVAPPSCKVEKVELRFTQKDRDPVSFSQDSPPSQTFSYNRGSTKTAAFPLDLAQPFQAQIVVHSQRGTFSSPAQIIEVAAPAKSQWPKIDQAPNFNPLLRQDDNSWSGPASAITVSSLPAELWLNADSSITFVDGDKSSSLKDATRAVYDVLLREPFENKSDWHDCMRYLYGSERVDSEWQKKCAPMLEAWLAPQMERTVYVDIKTTPKANSQYKLSLDHRTAVHVKPVCNATNSQVQLKEFYSLDVAACTVDVGKVFSNEIIWDYNASKKCWDSKPKETGDTPWFDDLMGTKRLDLADTRLKGMVDASFHPTLTVRPGATIILRLDLAASGPSGGQDALGSYVPFVAYVENVSADNPDVSFEATSRSRDILTNGGTRITTFSTDYSVKDKSRTCAILRLKVSKKPKQYSYTIKGGIAGQTRELAKIEVPYETIELLAAGRSLVTTELKGVLVTVKLKDDKRIQSLSDRQKKSVEEHIEWFVHNRPRPGSSKKVKKVGEGLMCVFNVENEFIDKQDRDLSEACAWRQRFPQSSQDLVYLTARSANTITTYRIVLSPKTTGQCSGKNWKLDLEFKTGFAISYLISAAFARVEWKAECVNCPDLKVTGFGYMFRFGLGLNKGLDVFFNKTWTGWIYGVEWAELLNNPFTGVYYDASALGMGGGAAIAWKGYWTPCLVMSNMELMSLKGPLYSLLTGKGMEGVEFGVELLAEWLGEKASEAFKTLKDYVNSLPFPLTFLSANFSGVAIILTDAEIEKKH